VPSAARCIAYYNVVPGYGAEAGRALPLECGGKTPQVVLQDADLTAAASGIVWGIFYNHGETCHAGSRLICDARIKDELLAQIRRVAATITLGHPFEPATNNGCADR
jgi:acyl-CoA reductase-like NAD-dependent aldehyde dehydrogenase